MYKAELNFKSREQAEQFATRWAFYSKTGYTLGSGKENVSVTLYNVTDEHKSWLDNQVSQINA